MTMRAAMLIVLVMITQAAAQSSPALPYPQEYKTTLVKYAVVDRVDGMSRDLYASAATIAAVKREPALRELPAGAVFAIDAYRAKALGKDAKTGALRFEATPQGRLIRSKDERTLHLMQKIRPGSGSGNWAFGAFDPLTTAPLKIDLPGDCLLCHQAAVVSDMAYSMSLLKRFVASGAVQYRWCQHPGRQSCAFP